MSASLHIICPTCQATNRVPAARLGDRPICGECKGRLFSGHPVELDAASFDHHLSGSDIPLVVDFWAPWCGPCLAMAPVFERAAESLEPRVRLAKLNTDKAPEVSARFDIRGIPTLILFSGGQERARMSGAMDLRTLLDWIDLNVRGHDAA